jgi:hypothetical protein
MGQKFYKLMVSIVEKPTYKYKQKWGAELMKGYIGVGIWNSLNIFKYYISRRYTVKKGWRVSRPYSRPGKVLLVTSRLGTGNKLTFFYRVIY